MKYPKRGTSWLTNNENGRTTVWPRKRRYLYLDWTIVKLTTDPTVDIMAHGNIALCERTLAVQMETPPRNRRSCWSFSNAVTLFSLTTLIYRLWTFKNSRDILGERCSLHDDKPETMRRTTSVRLPRYRLPSFTGVFIHFFRFTSDKVGSSVTFQNCQAVAKNQTSSKVKFWKVWQLLSAPVTVSGIYYPYLPNNAAIRPFYDFVGRDLANLVLGLFWKEYTVYRALYFSHLVPILFFFNLLQTRWFLFP